MVTFALQEVDHGYEQVYRLIDENSMAPVFLADIIPLPENRLATSQALEPRLANIGDVSCLMT
jgi:hypothetical protein